MVIITQEELVTTSQPWWNSIFVEPEDKLEVLLGVIDTDFSLKIAKFRSQKKALALFEAISTAIDQELPRFNVNKWVVENYSE